MDYCFHIEAQVGILKAQTLAELTNNAQMLDSGVREQGDV